MGKSAGVTAPLADSPMGDGECCVNGTGREDAASPGHPYKG